MSCHSWILLSLPHNRHWGNKLLFFSFFFFPLGRMCLNGDEDCGGASRTYTRKDTFCCPRGHSLHIASNPYDPTDYHGCECRKKSSKRGHNSSSEFAWELLVPSSKEANESLTTIILEMFSTSTSTPTLIVKCSVVVGTNLLALYGFVYELIL